jgi:hypothetical protein
MADLEFYVSNKAYGQAWLDQMKESNPSHFAVIEAILAVIQKNDGGDISNAEVFAQDPEVAAYVRSNEYDIVPSRGQELCHNGKGIRHAKYSPSKNIAILWEKIGDTIYFTFDDHAPVRFHRAIYCLCELRLGKEPFPLKSRDSRKILSKIWKKGFRKNKGLDPNKRYYK